MTLSLFFLLAGAGLVAGSAVSYRASEGVLDRSVSAAALAAGSVMLLIGLVNALSGTL